MEAGQIFAAQATYPFEEARQKAALRGEDPVRDVVEGEMLKVLAVETEENQVTFENKSLGTPDAWFLVSMEEAKILTGIKEKSE